MKSEYRIRCIEHKTNIIDIRKEDKPLQIQLIRVKLEWRSYI